MSVKTKPLAATYCRISYDKRKNEAGVDRQQADTDALARKLGYRVVERIVDNDRSASRRARHRRDGFHRLRELVETNAVNAVIVYDLDRFTRNPDELGAWIDAAAMNPGVKLITTGDILDLSDDDAIFKARILLAVAEKEASNTARRVKREAAAAAEKGVPRWSVRPFGFQLDGTHVPAEVAHLRAMYADVIAGRSQSAIALDLNESGVANPTDAPWQSATIGFLVRNPRNAGLRAHLGNVVGRAAWEPIVTEKVWRDAVAALDARKAGSRPHPRSLLGGLVRCASCGGTMSRSGRGYRCVLRSDGRQSNCGTMSIAADSLDRYVTGLVLAALGATRPKEKAKAVKDSGHGQQRAEVLKLQANLEEVAAMFGRGELSLSEFKAAKQPLDLRLAAATNLLARTDTDAALERIAGPPATLAERWDSLDVALRGRIVGTVIESITVRKSTRNTGTFSPERLTVRWVK